MRIGKLNNDALDALVLSKLRHTRREVSCAPQIGVDCAALDFGGSLIVVSTDPITSATANLGRLTVHVSCNDAAAAGAEPVGLLVTLLAPPDCTEADIDALTDELASAAAEANVDIIGGHTEITGAVTRMITCATVIARSINDAPIMPDGAEPGDDIVLTKSAGMEGAAIIASDLPELLGDISECDIARAKGFFESISVVPEGICAARNGAKAMHDVTEGGVYGALWELAHASGCKLIVESALIPVDGVTRRICDAAGVDVYRLISSGCMLIACADGMQMCERLGQIGVSARVVGRAASGSGVEIDGRLIEPPGADELYKLFEERQGRAMQRGVIVV
ncbi:MAG: AIR synthase family protein [Clostridia bacterium]|nr:AIR synthase family protein [Clostridia bacterium]